MSHISPHPVLAIPTHTIASTTTRGLSKAHALPEVGCELFGRSLYESKGEPWPYSFKY